MTVSVFFEVPADRLMTAPFEELLTNELADRDRLRRVEEKVRPGQEASMRSRVTQQAIELDEDQPFRNRCSIH
jgi:hypothetical protein